MPWLSEGEQEKKLSPLHWACIKDNVEICTFLLDKKAKIEAKDLNGCTPLNLVRGKLVGQLLLEHGAYIDDQDTEKLTLLHKASRRGDIEVCKLLLKRGANKDLQDREGFTPLHWSCTEGYIDTRLPAWFEEIDQLYGDQGYTDGSFAKVKVEITKLLLEKGASVLVAAEFSSTAFDLALQGNRIENCKLILATIIANNVEFKNPLDFTPLHAACYLGDSRLCELLLKKDVNKEALDKEGNTPLHLACKKGNVEVCHLLLNSKINIEAKKIGGLTLLHVACQEGFIQVCVALVSKGANIEARTDNEEVPLHLACKRGKLEVCQFLLKNGANIAVKDKDGSTPLHIVCREEHADISRFLLEKKANIDSQDKEGKTPLHLVIPSFGWHKFTKGRIEICTLLLAKGANTSIQDKKGKTPLHLAMSSPLDSGLVKERNEICTLLIEKESNLNIKDGDGRTPLHLAILGPILISSASYDPILHASQVKYDICVLLLQKGANVNAQDKDQKTPLHLEISSPIDKDFPGKMNDLCLLLLQKGANKDVQDKDGKTPLHLAISRGKLEIFRLLLEKGASKETQSNEGSTPLHEACDINDDVACSYLLEKGANENARTKTGATPLILASKRGSKKIVNLLLGHSKIIKELKDTTLEGNALHWACLNNHLEVCKELLRAGLSPNETANTLSVLHLAVKGGNSEMVDLFLERQSNCNMGNRNGATALHLSCELGSDSITETLLAKKDLYKININALTHTGKTPLHTAVENNQPAIVNLLLRYGALPNELDVYNKTPLMYAAEKRQLENCTVIKAKISIALFNEIKLYLGSLVRGHKELEKLFEIYTDLSMLPRYDAVPSLESQRASSSDMPSTQDDGIDQVSGEDDLMLDQVSEQGDSLT